MSVFAVRTDLALEEGERIRESGVEIHGVILEEETRPETGILVTRVKIETKNGSKIMGKPIGTYVTLEAGQLGNDEEEYQQEVAKELSMQLQKLIPDPEARSPDGACWLRPWPVPREPFRRCTCWRAG